MTPLTYIHVSYFNRLKVLAGVSKKLQKLHTIKYHKQKGNMKTCQMTPSFMYFFFTWFVTFIFISENSKNSFSCGPDFGPF